MPDQADQHGLDRLAPPGVAHQDGHRRVKVKRDAHVGRVIAGGAVEAVDGDHERDPVMLEVVDRGEAAGQAAGVGQHDRAEGTEGQFLPHEPEAFLARHAKQVERQVGPEGDPAEVHGDRRGGLAAHSGQVIHPDAPVAQRLLRAQRPDLRDGAD